MGLVPAYRRQLSPSVMQNNISKELYSICSDIDEWPERWEIDFPDIDTGKKLLYSVFVPFFEYLITTDLSKRTLKRHIDNIWLLGGEIIERVNFDEDLRELPGPALIMKHIDEFGGPFSRHLYSQAEINSFNSSCKKLYKYMNLKQKELA